MLFAVKKLLYFCISTSRSLSAVPNTAVWFIIIIIIIIIIVQALYPFK
jgi:hypothetical protein